MDTKHTDGCALCDITHWSPHFEGSMIVIQWLELKKGMPAETCWLLQSGCILSIMVNFISSSKYFVIDQFHVCYTITWSSFILSAAPVSHSTQQDLKWLKITVVSMTTNLWFTQSELLGDLDLVIRNECLMYHNTIMYFFLLLRVQRSNLLK